MTSEHPQDPHQEFGTETLRFGCSDCCQRNTIHCEDCLVTHMCGDSHGDVVVSMDEMRLVKRLQSLGLAPPNRHRRQIV
jgi:hypothetical protein